MKILVGFAVFVLGGSFLLFLAYLVGCLIFRDNPLEDFLEEFWDRVEVGAAAIALTVVVGLAVVGISYGIGSLIL